MKAYDTILFDLDGTLLDSAPGVTHAYALALEIVGIHIEDPERELRRVLGPPLSMSFTGFFGVPPEKLDRVLEVYLSHYVPYGSIYESGIYPGVEDLLRRLRSAGKRLAVASSKREDMVLKVLGHFGLDKYFDLLAGSSAPDGRSTKADVLRYIIDTLPIPDLSRAVMVGDRKYDAEGASELGIDTVGVLYGYGDRPELESAGVVATAATPEELGELLGV